MDKFVTLNFVDDVAYLLLNKPQKHNAFDDQMIQMLISSLEVAKKRSGLRALVLHASGKNFCAGADLSWMKRMAGYSYQENLEDARALAQLMKTLNDFPAPTLALVQGAAYGGALGLIACCDIVIASDLATFCLSEVKLALAPATIGPYVAKALGLRRAQYLFLTAEKFTAQQAYDWGLVHQLCNAAELEDAKNRTLKQILLGGPNAQREVKKLVRQIEANAPDLIDQTSELIAKLRVSEEGQAGLSAFFEQTPAPWVKPK